MFIVVAIIAAYLLGAIPFALLIGRIAGIKDLRQVGSGNLGATNVWRAAGPGAGVAVLFADTAKGVAAILAARYILAEATTLPVSIDVVLVMAGLAAVLGHVFPVYVWFKGGKGAATGLGVMVMLLPLPTAVALVVFLVVAVLWRFVSLASMAGALALLAAVIVEKYLLVHSVADIYFIMTVALALLMIVTHRQNIARLLRGAEHRFSFSSRSGGAGSHG